MPDPAPAEATEPSEPPEPASDSSQRWKPVVLLADPEREPASDVSEEAARSILAAVSALWHPAILARVERLPRTEDAESPGSPNAWELRLVAGGAEERLPSGYRTQAEDCGALLVEAGDLSDRLALAARALARIDAEASLQEAGPEGDRLALDFLALGTARWLLRLVTV
ncbi:MAG TPA: glycosyl hydrolase family 38, partial [Isosphaeraceae bacterium]|nr:glycosyl hydrolase family 38 [Isosphaeraceae bacterium]